MQENKRDTDVQNRLFDSVEEGEGGMIWENGIETCIISYMKRIASTGFSPETVMARKKWNNIFKMLKEKNSQLHTLYQVKISFRER